MRLALGPLLVLALSLPLAAAPVPKRGPADPPVLTAAGIAGEWAYAWGQWPDGGIIFDRDGSYGAIHVPGAQTWYYGSWSVKGNVLTLDERGYDLATGRTWVGGRYEFDFGATRAPALSGLSNGATPVKLTKPQR